MHRATSDDAFTQALFDYSRSSVFPQSVKKTGTNVDTYNEPTNQCTDHFNNMGSFNRKSEFRKSENLNKPINKGEKFNFTNDPQLSRRSKDLSVHARIDSTGYVRLLGESSEENDKFGKKAEEVIAEPRERTNWQSAGWDSSDQARKVTTWQSHSLWQSGHLH